MQTGIDEAIIAMGSQAALANAVGVTQQAISVWKKRGYVPLKKIEPVARVSGVPARRLLPPLFV